METEKIPQTLGEAIALLVAETSKSDQLESAKKMTEREFLGATHHGLGMHLRNTWKLWFDETPLSQWFTSLGCVHGDDRSSIILTSFHREINKLPWDVEGQIEHFKAWWRKQGFEDGIPKQ